MPVAGWRVKALEKIHLAVPAVRKLIILGVLPVPFQPVFMTGE